MMADMDCNLQKPDESEYLKYLRKRFYAINGHDVKDTDTFKPRKEYFLTHVEDVINWKGSVNSILLHHLKQIILVSCQLAHESPLEKLLWNQLIFYLLQYIQYSTSSHTMHLFNVSFISIHKIIKILKLFKSAITQKRVNKEEINRKIRESLSEDFEMIRGNYILNRILTYLKLGQYTNMYGKVRILLMLGECLKNSSDSPNINKNLEKIIINNIPENFVNTLKDFRNKASHLENIDLYLRDSFSSIHSFRIMVKKFLKIYYEYLKNEETKLALVTDETSGCLELPNTYYLKKQSLIIFNQKMHMRKLIDDSINEPKNPDLCTYQSIINVMIQDMETDKNRIKGNIGNHHFFYEDYLKILQQSYKNESTLDLEMNLMITLKYLQGKKRLNPNRKWYMDNYPTLTPLELRNHLGHNDTIVATLNLDEEMIVKDTAKLFIEELNQPDLQELPLGMKTTLSIKDLDNYSQVTLKNLRERENFIDIIHTTEFEEMERYINCIKDDWRLWTTYELQNILHLACKRKDMRIFNFIKNEAPELIKEKDNNGNTIFHLATINRNINIVKHILETKDCQCLIEEQLIQNNQGETPFHLAAILGYQEFIELFLSNQDLIKFVQKPSNYGWSPIMYATYDNHVSIVKLLTMFSFKYIQTCLYVASYFGAEDTVKYLIELGANVNCYKYEYKIEFSHYIANFNALEVAIEREHTKISNVLMENGAYRILRQYDTPNSRELFIAIEEGSLDDVEHLLRHNSKLIGEHNRIDGRNSMHYAVLSRNIQLVKSIYYRMPHFLLISDRNGITPIELSADLENSEILEFILELIVFNSDKRPYALWSLHKQFINEELRIRHYDIIFMRAVEWVKLSKTNNFLLYCILCLLNNIFQKIAKHSKQITAYINMLCNEIAFIMSKDYSITIKINCLQLLIDVTVTMKRSSKIIQSIFESINSHPAITMFFLEQILEKTIYNSINQEYSWVIPVALNSAKIFKNNIQIQIITLKILQKFHFDGDKQKILQFIKSILNEYSCNTEIINLMPKFIPAFLQTSAKSQKTIMKLILPMIGQNGSISNQNNYKTHNEIISKFINIQYSYMQLLLECFLTYNYQPENSVMVDILERVVKNISSFWICDDIMRIGIQLVFYLMDHIKADYNATNPYNTKAYFNLIVNIPRKYSVFNYFPLPEVSSDNEMKFLCHLVVEYSNDEIIQKVASKRIQDNIDFLIQRNDDVIDTILQILNNNINIKYDIIRNLFFKRDYSDCLQKVIKSTMTIVLEESVNIWTTFKELCNQKKFTSNQVNVLLPFVVCYIDKHNDEEQQKPAIKLLWTCWTNYPNRDYIRNVAVHSYISFVTNSDPPKELQYIIKSILRICENLPYLKHQFREILTRMDEARMRYHLNHQPNTR